MMSLLKPIPIPRPEPYCLIEERRLWIGNLDSRITEFQLLKILQKYGTIEKFDLLFHKTGPLAGQPRGYGFVTFKEKEVAEAMKSDLDGRKIGSKCVSVKWAHSLEKSEDGKPKPEVIPLIPALGVKKEKKISPEMQIKAIEMKLKMMEHSGDEEFKITIPSSSTVNLPKKRPAGDIKTKPNPRHQPYLIKK